jgi:N-terminus of Esterase_SGNH_hydro-type/GDSL-like Lipase/Acylhydrolase family
MSKSSPHLLLFLAFVSIASAQKAPDVSKLDPAMGVNKKAADNLEWHDVTKWGVEGRILPEQTRLRWFDRLPASAEKSVTPAVWSLSRDSSGMMVRFKTDATAISVHYKLSKDRLAQPHMPATGVSGVDLYARDTDGKWKWVMVTKPATQEVKAEIIKDLAPGEREYAAYLPLYNGVEFMSIGVAKGSKFEELAPREKPVVFYGTSITHGACASRPGMVHTGILGRKLDMPVVNPLRMSSTACPTWDLRMSLRSACRSSNNSARPNLRRRSCSSKIAAIPMTGYSQREISITPTTTPRSKQRMKRCSKTA